MTSVRLKAIPGQRKQRTGGCLCPPSLRRKLLHNGGDCEGMIGRIASLHCPLIAMLPLGRTGTAIREGATRDTRLPVIGYGAAAMSKIRGV
jgi:hypothetical protein